MIKKHKGVFDNKIKVSSAKIAEMNKAINNIDEKLGIIWKDNRPKFKGFARRKKRKSCSI